jgi:hypothetical protein
MAAANKKNATKSIMDTVMLTLKQCKWIDTRDLVDNHKDQVRAWRVKNWVWNIRYEQYEYTRLQRVRVLMD